MGCDIHMYVQYREKKKNDDGWWWDFGGHMNPGRDYSLFGILAGVRDRPEKGYDPKGIPDFELGWGARHDLYLTITEDGLEENCCTLEQAERYHRPIIKDKDGKSLMTMHPDWHNHSWLTTEELAQAYRWLKKYEKRGPGLEYRVLLKMMKALEDNGKNEVVVVFWFDN